MDLHCILLIEAICNCYPKIYMTFHCPLYHSIQQYVVFLTFSKNTSTAFLLLEKHIYIQYNTHDLKIKLFYDRICEMNLGTHELKVS